MLIGNFETKTPDLLRKYDIPGAAISIVENGQLKWIGTFGYADLEEELETQKGTLYQVASISKSVTAVAIMKLSEEGILNLDDPVEKYITRWEIPDSIYDKNEVTIRRLLSHTAGLSVGGGYPGYEPYTPIPTLEESLDGVGGGSRPVKLTYEPGSRFSYSGGGYNLLQMLIEEVTGKDFAVYMGLEILTPLGMENSSFQWETHMYDSTAKAYNQKLELLPNYLFIEKAAAGLYTTIEDMSKLVIAEINSYKGEGFLHLETIREMYEPILEIKGLEGLVYQNVGLGHFVNVDKNNRVLIGHDGSNKGWRASFSIDPVTENGIVILTNSDNGTFLLNEVLNSWYYTVFQEERSYDKLEHRVIASIYSVSSILLLWSAIKLLQLYEELRKGNLGIILLRNKIKLVIRIILCAAMVYSLYLFRINIVPLLAFIRPNIGIILALSLYLRALLFVIQLLTIKKSDHKMLVI